MHLDMSFCAALCPIAQGFFLLLLVHICVMVTIDGFTQPLCLIQLTAKLHIFAVFFERYLIFSSSFMMKNGYLLS